MHFTKTQAARFSIGSNSFLIIIKLVAGLITGSVSMISEAIHSVMDLLAAIIAFFAVRLSDTPPDDQHPYGHGKFENVSGVIEGLLIYGAVIWIVYEAINKLYDPAEVKYAIVAAVIMIGSAIINLIISNILYKTAREKDSVALEADALHLKTDVYTSAGVGIGLLILWITDLQILDSIIAIGVAIFILFEATKLIKKAFSPLVDTSLDNRDIDIIRKVMQKQKVPIYNLKTRKAGQFKFTEFNIELSGELTLSEAHDVCTELENCIKKEINNIEVTIHPEPLGTNN